MDNIKTLYITEKQSQLEDLAKVLNCKVTRKWYPAYNDSEGIAIIPLKGHLYELLSRPQDYDEAFAKWEDKTVLCFPNEFKKKPKKGVVDQVNRSLDHIKRANEIIIASDFDNEGANLAYTVIQAAGGENKVSRMLEMGSTTEDALRRTLENPINIPYKAMAEAGEARARVDWIEGMSYSRALTLYLGQGRSLLVFGGVKSPVIKFVVERDLQFESHSKIKFYTIAGKAKKDNKLFDISVYRKIDGKKEKKFDKKEHAQLVKTAIDEIDSFKLNSLTTKNKKEGPKQLYDLIEISSELSRDRGSTSDEALETAQYLYDTVKIQSYPRTAIKYLKEEDYSMVPTYLKNLKKVMHSEIIEQIMKNPLLKRSSVFNSAKVTSHGALTPTEEKSLSKIYPNLRTLERAMFDKVSTRFIANFMPDYEFEETLGEIHLYDDVYCSFSEHIPKKAGWKYIYDKEIIERIKNYEKFLPEMKKGDDISVDSLQIKEGETKPKPRFKMDTLQKAMGNIANIYPEDKILKEELGENGIGTPATIPGILKELFATVDHKGEPKEPWLKLEGKNVVSTPIAREMVRVSPEGIMSPVKRAKLMQNIKEIEQGRLSLDDFMIQYKEEVIENIDKIKEAAKDPANLIKKKVNQEKLGSCPICDGEIYETGKAFICDNANWKKDDNEKWINSGCGYSIFKKALEAFGKSNITKTDVKKLLSSGKLSVKLTRKDSKEKYTTEMIVSEKYGLGFAPKKEFPSIGECPFCKSPFLEKDKIFSCSGAKWKKEGDEFINHGCKFQIRRNQLERLGGKKITTAQVKNLLENGEVEFDLKSKEDQPYKKVMVPDLKWGLAWKK